MTKHLHYGTTAKVFHWAIVALLVVQYSIGWLMPDVHSGPPGVPMVWHISIGTVILALIAVRFLWRLTHPVAPESSLSPWQRITSEAVHWLLYLLVLLTTLSGWLFASARGWNVSWFFVTPLPMLTSGNRALVKALDGMASELHVGFVDRLRTTHRHRSRTPVLLPRWRDASDAAG
jgi:cytochrome b561